MSIINMRNMNKLRYFALIALLSTIIGCNRGLEEPEMSREEQERAHKAYLVDKIEGNTNYMLTEYTYDNNNLLIRKSVSDRIVESYRIIYRKSEYKLEYENGRLMKIATRHSGSDFESNIEKFFEYDSKGRPLYGGKFAYDDQGKLVSTYSYEFGGILYQDELVWDDRGNVVKHICPSPKSNMIWEPIPGTYQVRTLLYEYDNHPKPNFGFGDMLYYSFDPWPLMGTAGDRLISSLSKNNLVKAEGDGHAFHYTYNENGLPATVETIWIGIETLDPMIMTITYKKITE